MENETWKPIQNYENLYKISNIGRVMSLIKRWPSRKNYILKHNKTTTGYHQVHLYKNKKRKSFLVHRLVAIAFLSNCPVGYETNHKDGNKDNNKIENLEWITSSENNQHSYKMGLRQKPNISGEANPNAKLSKQEVVEIRALKGSISQRKLAERYKVARTTIQWIHQNKHWIN